MLYDIERVKKKIQKLYDDGTFFHAFIERNSLFPLSLKLKTPSQNSLRENMATLFDEIHQLEKLQLHIEYKAFTFKSLGVQNLPVAVVIKSEEKFLKLLGKKRTFEIYQSSYRKAVSQFPHLKQLFLHKPNFLLQNSEIVDELLAICHFFTKKPRPNIYIRELSIKGVDTKFIQQYKSSVDAFLSTVLDENCFDHQITKLSNNGFEKKYGLKYELPLVRFRILDETLYINELNDITITNEAFENLELPCQNIFIVENKITMLSFMRLANSIVIFGNGYGVSMVKNAKWMATKNIYYWGDIDLDGFAILSQARGYFSQIKSLFMDEETIEIFKDLAVSKKEQQRKNLQHLNREEQLIYERLSTDFYKEDFRLEQERIPFEHITQILPSATKILPIK